MINVKHNPMLIVVSAPSGAGKTTLCDRLIREHADMVYSVSCTTRLPRVGEVDGSSYHFLSTEEFNARAQSGEFLEHAEVHGNWYGTLRATVHTAMAQGHDVLMDIDVQGADQIRRALALAPSDDVLRQAYVDIFIAPPSMRDLQLRLWGRGKDDEGVIERRLSQAQAELACWRQYQYIIVNDRLDDSYRTLESIIFAERHRVTRLVDV
jgi:guanylate kinase